MFKHYLITRFNLRKTDWSVDKQNVAVLTDQWHDNRFKIFNDFCFHSVKHQTNTNFEWLVFFDETTAPKYRAIIANLKEQMPNFVPIFVDGMDAFLPTIQSILSQCNEDYIITSRIDNDDCLSIHYIEEVQKRFNKQDYRALDFIDGYTIQITPDVKVAKRLDQFNPFISLIERNNNPKSVWNVRHSHWKREKRITQVKNLNIWASVIHQENKVNGFGGFGHVDLEEFFQEFHLPSNQKNYIIQHNIPVKKWRMLSLKNAYRSYTNLFWKNIKRRLGVYKFK